MKKLLLACTAGMSTRLLIPSADAVLLGPQIGYALGEMERSVHGQIPVDVISMRDYGHLNAKGIIDHAMEMLSLS